MSQKLTGEVCAVGLAEARVLCREPIHGVELTTVTQHQAEVGTGYFDQVVAALNPSSATTALAGSPKLSIHLNRSPRS